jgi:prophage DNA circulation protein
MAGIFDQLQVFSFDGIKFAVTKYSVKGGLREHMHEYRHTPGGQLEKLGRKAYTIECDAIFSSDTPKYPVAWPDDLSNLRFLFESEWTSDLVIPTLGTMRCCCVDWPTEVDFQRFRNGERAKFTFREDQQKLQSFDEAVKVTYATVAAKADALVFAIEDAELSLDAFEAVLDVANQISSYKDQVELQAEILSDKVGQLTNACQTLDDTLDILDDPPHFKVLDAVQDLWSASISLQEDVLKKANPVSLFTTTAQMAVTDLATLIYGDTGRAMELLMLNPIDDAFTIPAGTSVKFYLPAA